MTLEENRMAKKEESVNTCTTNGDKVIKKDKNRDVIIACDFPSGMEALAFLRLLENSKRKPFVKIGMELFYAEGPNIVRQIKKMDYKIFLDLKLHDIPNTVKSSMKVLRDLGVDMCNLHCAGGIEMMEGAIEGLTRADGTRPILLGVTQLTSTSQRQLTEEILIDKPLDEVVATYAQNAKKAGLDGVVCSPLETKVVKEACGSEFLTVTPGIRFEKDNTQDQKRVTTVAEAKALGTDFIVVGRPITRAENPLLAYEKCLQDFL